VSSCYGGPGKSFFKVPWWTPNVPTGNKLGSATQRGQGVPQGTSF